MTRPQPPRMVNTTCSSFQFAGLPGSSQGYATLGGALGSAARNGRRRVREGQRQGSSRRVELDAERAFTSGRASVRPLGRHPRATGRVEKYPTGAQSEGFGARGWERTGHATGGLGHGALGHRVEAAGQGGGGAKNSGHLRVVARTEVASESGDRKVGDTVSSRRRGRPPDSANESVRVHANKPLSKRRAQFRLRTHQRRDHARHIARRPRRAHRYHHQVRLARSPASSRATRAAHGPFRVLSILRNRDSDGNCSRSLPDTTQRRCPDRQRQRPGPRRAPRASRGASRAPRLRRRAR
jgi:hypothetical protein